MTNSRNSRFGRFAPTYKCNTCGRQTRETGDGESGCQLCRECFTIAGEDNHYNDNGLAPTAKETANLIALLQTIKDKGGDYKAVASFNNYAFPLGVPPLRPAKEVKANPKTATRYPGPYTVSDKAKALGFDGLRLHVGSGRYYLMAYAFDAGRAITREEVAEVLEGHNMEDAISGMMRYGFLV